MKPFIELVRRILLIASLGCFANWAAPSFAQTTNEIRIVELQGNVEISPKGATTWVLTQTNQTVYPFDRMRTGPNSRVALRWSDESVVPFGAQTELEILPPHAIDAEPGLHLVRGILSFFHRDKPSRIRVITRGATAGIEGTEFVMEVTETGDTERTTLSVVDGKVSFANEQAALVLTNDQQAVAEPGKAPLRTPGFIANNLLQWCFYYPAVLDLNDLSLTPEEQSMLDESLTAYRAGDLLAALAKYPEARQPASDAGRAYHAALLLSVGQVEKAQTSLSALAATGVSEKPRRLATALRMLIAAVKREKNPSVFKPELATELLAASYYEQSLTGPNALKTALDLARQAVANSPDFSFGWERVAELEFSFGHTDRALEALEKSLAMAPRNAQALALRGFLLAAQNKTREAIDWFDRALTMDAALGNAWLGRGLCRIRRGDTTGGREDLLIAAALEPERATLRSYLGKAWSDAGDDARARNEFDRSRKLDPQDPTSWLYSALNNERHNRINEAIADLEKSQELNDNRSVYRSGLLLDQDRAARSANLARIYADAGMTDVAFREASRAVASDYANYSAHYFLANSYNALRDPRLVNLRFETAESAEYLLANLLAPVGAGIFSPAISQNEYSRLFERDHLGAISETEYLSRGAWLERGAQYGTIGNTSYSLEGFYRSDTGERPNNDLEQMQLALVVKQQLTPQDTAYVQASFLNTEAGDVAQRYDPLGADLTFRSRESQDGLINIGYHHEWSPESHTLFLAGYLPDRLLFSDQTFPTWVVDSAANTAYPLQMAQTYRADTKIYFAEAQQILQPNAHHLSIFGTRFQWGEIKTQSQQMNPTDFQAFFPPLGTPASIDNLKLNIQRFSVYGYHHWEILDHLWLIGGVSYDRLEFPENFLFAPLSNRTQTEDKLLPKAGFVWSPYKDTTLRFAYTRSLSGATLEQSYRLEPAQVAGFTQAYRGVIPESSVGGPTPGAPFDTYDLSLEQKVTSTTYLGLTGEILNSDFTRTIGGYSIDSVNALNAGPAEIRQHLSYREQSLAFTASQLVGQNWSFGLRYRITQSELNQQLREVVSPALTLINTGDNLESVLQQLSLDAGFYHPSGIFARFNALWNLQSNRGYDPDQPGDEFWHFNTWIGYRFAQRRAEVSLGVLNLTDRDYRLNPLTPFDELPHRRTLTARLVISF